MKHLRHHAHHSALIYPVSLRDRLYTFLLGPLAVVAVVYMFVTLFPLLQPAGGYVPLGTILAAAAATFLRLFIAYVLAVLFALPLAILATRSRMLESFLLPVFDVLESIPILAFFPVVVLLFIKIDMLEGAAIFILFLNMLWNIVFTVVGGLKIIPRDISSAARVFGLSGFKYIRRVMLPAIFPQFVTGSILAVAEGWNLIIVAEALHTYIPHGESSQDLFGIGSILVQAAGGAQNTTFVLSLTVMILLIAALNLFVWQRLLVFSQRFRFE